MRKSWPRKPDNYEAQFWMRVDTSGGPDACWPWLAATLHRGHGVFTYKGRPKIASRVAWELTYGPLVDDECALHTCDNPPCCNPAHLFKGTRDDNNKDRAAKGRSADTSADKNPSAVLDWERVRLMRDLIAVGEKTTKQIAEDFGVSYHTAVDISTNNSWFDPAYIPPPRRHKGGRSGGRKKAAI